MMGSLNTTSALSAGSYGAFRPMEPLPGLPLPSAFAVPASSSVSLPALPPLAPLPPLSSPMPSPSPITPADAFTPASQPSELAPIAAMPSPRPVEASVSGVLPSRPEIPTSFPFVPLKNAAQTTASPAPALAETALGATRPESVLSNRPGVAAATGLTGSGMVGMPMPFRPVGLTAPSLSPDLMRPNHVPNAPAFPVNSPVGALGSNVLETLPALPADAEPAPAAGPGRVPAQPLNGLPTANNGAGAWALSGSPQETGQKVGAFVTELLQKYPTLQEKLQDVNFEQLPETAEQQFELFHASVYPMLNRIPTTLLNRAQQMVDDPGLKDLIGQGIAKLKSPPTEWAVQELQRRKLDGSNTAGGTAEGRRPQSHTAAETDAPDRLPNLLNETEPLPKRKKTLMERLQGWWPQKQKNTSPAAEESNARPATRKPVDLNGLTDADLEALLGGGGRLPKRSAGPDVMA